MWADNETDTDLLGFEFLTDGLVVALTEPRLLPLTVGVLGDWGSGKSSLMKIAAAELNPPPESAATAGDDEEAADDDATEQSDPNAPYLTIHFSPWQYEDVDDAKAALMNTVINAVAVRSPTDEERIGRLRSFVDRIKRLGRRAGKVATSSAPTVVPFLVQAAAPDTDPDSLELVGTLTDAVSKQLATAFDEPKPKADASNGTPPISTVDEFRKEFGKLINEADSPVEAVIVFVDDLDRCLPETVVDTFETIRLFLNTPKTAYVLALNQAVVESAIDSRYPDLKRADGAGIGRDYLEKMLQIKIVVPALSAAEAETYANLLFADLHLPRGEFKRAVAKAADNRAQNALAVAFNAGIAGELYGDIPAEFARDLAWSANMMPILGTSLRGNPRQLKRFLNNLLLKFRSASRRKVTLDLPTLAKMMVLEDQYNSDFQKLFDWQMGVEGPPLQLVAAEEWARQDSTGSTPSANDNHSESGASLGPDESPDPSAETADARAWADKLHIRDWLKIDPPLKNVDLRPYFTYSRDKLSFGVSASRLAPHLQQLLAAVQSDVEANRRSNYPAVATLDPLQRAQLVEALLERVHRYPQGTAFITVLEIAERSEDVVDTIAESLQRIPPASIPSAVGTTAVRRLPQENSKVVELLNHWETSSNTGLAGTVKVARRPNRRGR